MSEEVNFLLEAGFSKAKAERALKANSNNVQEALEWLLAHSDDPEEVQPAKMDTDEAKPKEHTLNLSSSKSENKPAETAESSAAAAAAEEASAIETANSLKCDDCGILLRDEDYATAHAHKTGHVNFSQSTEAIKPKTKEEIEEQKKRLAEKLVRLRQEKQEKERAEEIEREKSRRKQGRQINEIKQKFHEDELKRIAEEKRREKQADIAYKQKIKDQIAKDREDKKRSQEAEKLTGSPVSAAVAPPPTVPQQPQEKKQYDECKIQIRLTDGKSMVQTFKASESLAAVRLWVEMNRTDGDGRFNLMQTFPRKVYTDEDMMRPLSDLGLVPASTLVISKQ